MCSPGCDKELDYYLLLVLGKPWDRRRAMRYYLPERQVGGCRSEWMCQGMGIWVMEVDSLAVEARGRQG